MKYDKLGRIYNDIRSASGNGEDKTQKNRTALCILIACLMFIVVIYMAFFPAPVYQKIEQQAQNAQSIEDLPLNFFMEEGQVSEEHQKTISQTITCYADRRDEIINTLTHSEITSAAIEICKGKIAAGNYGEGAQFGGYTWYIPESAENQNISLTAAEADQILYLYSCLYDQDIVAAIPGFYDIWLNGSTELPPVTYNIDAFGNTYAFKAKGGYYLEGEELAEAKREAYQAGIDAVCAYERENHLILSGIISKGLAIFSSKAYADGGWADTVFVSAYMEAYGNYCASHGGSAFIDTVIYTGVSDQMPGEIVFSLCGDPAPIWNGATSYEGTIEDYYKDSWAQSIVQGFVDNPLTGKLKISVDVETKKEIYETEGGTYTTKEWKDIPYSYPVLDSSGNPCYDYDGNQLFNSGTTTELVDVEKSPEWMQYHNECIYSLSIEAYQCQEMVDFIFMASVNGSGIPNALDQLIKNAYDSKGETDWTIYRPGGNPAKYNNAWCAVYVDFMMRQVGIDDFTTEAGCGYVKSYLGGEKGTPMKDYNGNPLGNGDTCKGLPSYAMQNITCWGGDGYTPKAGDIVLWYRDGAYAHIGFVTEISSDSVTIANGNNNDMVQWGEYTQDDGLGLGAGIIFDCESLYTDIALIEQTNASIGITER